MGNPFIALIIRKEPDERELLVASSTVENQVGLWKIRLHRIFVLYSSVLLGGCNAYGGSARAKVPTLQARSREDRIRYAGSQIRV